MLRTNYTDGEVATAYQHTGGNYSKMARELTNLGRGTVSRQLARYWATQLDCANEAGGTDATKLYVSNLNNRSDLNELRRHVRELTKWNTIVGTFRDGIDQLKFNQGYTVPPVIDVKPNGKKMTVEALFSDLQIGKLGSHYNTEVAKRRVQEYFRALHMKIMQHVYLGYEVERVVLVLLGDIIESDKKHPNSARATDTGTATQLVDAYHCLVQGIIDLAQGGMFQVDVLCVTGNHDHDGHGLVMFRAGKEQLSYTLYKTLQHYVESYCPNVKFTVPEGCFTHTDIYGGTIVYEHGVGVAPTATAMETRRNQRAQQIGKHVRMFRMGDKHNICRFNNDTLVVNGAFFGTDAQGLEYSSILGFHNEAAQVSFFHVQRAEGDPRSSIFDTFVIQLDHIQ